MPPLSSDPILTGSVGTLQAAALESIGHYLQSSTLDSLLGNGYLFHLAALLYVIGVITAVVTVAVGGNYKFLLWFVLGPALFYAIVQDRVGSLGTEWRLSDPIVSQRDKFAIVQPTAKAQEDIDKATEGLKGTGPAKVIKLFAWYNRLSSALVKNLVDFTNFGDGNDERVIIQQMMRWFLAYRVRNSDPDAATFMGKFVQGQCGEYFSSVLSQALISNSTTPTPNATQLPGQTNRVATDPSSNFNAWLLNQPAAMEFAAMTFNVRAGRQSYDCKELWGLMMSVLRVQATAGLTEAITSNLPDGLEKNAIVNLYREKIKTAGPDEKVQYLINFATIRMFLDLLMKVNPNILRTANMPEGVLPGYAAESREQSAMDSWGLYNLQDEYYGKYNFFQAMLSLPAIQGMLLMFLAWSFPFFCLCLVIPGRHITFLLWFGLWFWVKSWDFGMALVRLVDKILFIFMPQMISVPDQALKDPIMAVKAIISSVDPTYSVATYYTMLASCMAAVPVITAFLVRKGGSEILHAVSQGFSQMSDQFGKAAASWQGNLIAKRLAIEVESEKLNAQIATLQEGADDLQKKGLQTSVEFQVYSSLISKATSQLGSRAGMESVSKLGSAQAEKAAAFSNYQLTQVENSIRTKVEMAGYKASTSDKNLKLAAMMVGLGRTNNDMSTGMPVKAFERQLMGKTVVDWGGAAAKGYEARDVMPEDLKKAVTGRFLK